MVTTWVLLTVPVLIVVFTIMVIHAPRVLATSGTRSSYRKTRSRMRFPAGDIAAAMVGGIQALMLVLPVGGMGVTAMNVVKRSVLGIRKLYQTRPAAGIAVGVACVLGVAFAAYTLWPNGEYRPIQKGEKWTAGEAISKAKDIPSGRPAFERGAPGGAGRRPAGSGGVDPGRKHRGGKHLW